MVRTIPAQFVRKCMSFSSCATLRKRRRTIFSNIHFFLFTITVLFAKMATRRKTRSVTTLEELYRENEDDSVTETASGTDDAENEEAESSHASETDADEDKTDGESQESEESTAAQTIDAPPRKRG